MLAPLTNHARIRMQQRGHIPLLGRDRTGHCHVYAGQDPSPWAAGARPISDHPVGHPAPQSLATRDYTALRPQQLIQGPFVYPMHSGHNLRLPPASDISALASLDRS